MLWRGRLAGAVFGRPSSRLPLVHPAAHALPLSWPACMQVGFLNQKLDELAEAAGDSKRQANIFRELLQVGSWGRCR